MDKLRFMEAESQNRHRLEEGKLRLEEKKWEEELSDRAKERRARLVQTALEKGMSADEIERILGIL